ncbi:tricarboxylate transporter [Loktanella sp. IMCC34160]|uniref:tricarboxylate transporter n=1 Tax=Loktanella sp. IMCC34160 TaxID=2510646 RepID=UPI00101D987D|nr:tricarboxylate transporter [Loktanella sp. IMCC34160]RYG89441.1 tricarboxylate transporter [Loktanella sp. IMCC34160]
MTITTIKALATSVAAAAILTSPAAAEVDFSGETIEWVIPFSETGGSARWANFFAPLLSEELPGNPTVVVTFMPGAGSTKGANWFQEQVHTDGTLLFGSSGSTQFPYLLGDPRVRYEYQDWIPVMATGTGGVAYINAEDGARFDGSANDLQDIDFIFGSQGATGLDLVPLLAWEMLGMNVEPVFGIKGRGDGRLMFERGEATIDYQTTSGYLSGASDLVDAGSAVPMMTWGALDENGVIVRDPTFPDIPSFKEVCEATDGCETEGVAWEAWKAFFIAGYPSQKIAFLPQGTPQEVVDTYVAAFEAVRARPDFAEFSSNEVGEYPMFVGAGAANATREATSVTADAKAFVINWLSEAYGVVIE